MKKIFKLSMILSVFALLLTGCGKSNESKNIDSSNNKDTVEITDIHGTLEVPINPKNVISLDNRTFETLSEWDIELIAVPKDVMTSDSTYVLDDSVKNIGNHGEPNLEIIAAANPDLVIVGQRFAKYYEEIQKLVPNAKVVDLSFDVSKEEVKSGESLIKGLKESTITLGKIFDKNEEANKLIKDLDESIDALSASYNGTDTIMSVIVSGGEIGFSAPNTGRVWGPMYQIFNWKSALEVDDTTSDHQGDSVSIEAIAKSNPDWILVLDRDAPISSIDESIPAEDVIKNSAVLKDVTAVKENQIIYAPTDTYLNESVQTYIKIFNSIKENFSK